MLPESPTAAPQSQTAVLSRNELSQKVLNAFRGKIQPTKVPGVYNLALALVAVAMILLPLIYLGLVGIVAYGTYYAAVYNTGMFQMMEGTRGRNSGRAAIFAMIIYIAPIIIGALLVIFMLKPLIAWGPRGPAPRKLNKNAEPFLFAFVEKVCQAVGAPVPAEIHVDCDVNASASFRRGMLSMFGNDLVLTIGLPLVGGLNMREFAGVLAHEFGHFTQFTGMRLTYIIRNINHWFARMVYQRDIFDEWLQSGRNSDVHLLVNLICMLTQFFVWLARWALFGMMMLGNAISSFMMRQMEYDADLHEARLAGNQAFEATVRRLAMLGIAHNMAHESLSMAWSEGRLADDLPALISANVGRISPDMLKKVQQKIAGMPTKTFDTHPSDRDRVTAVRKEKNNGIFWVEMPAKDLFRDYKALSRTVSTDLYQSVLGPDVRMSSIRPVEELIASDQAEECEHKALRRYMQTQISPVRALPLTDTLIKAPRKLDEHLAKLKAAREHVCRDAKNYAGWLKKFNDTRSAMVTCSAARMLVNLRVRIDARELKLPGADLKSINQYRQQLGDEQIALLPQMNEFERQAGLRLYHGLCLLKVPEIAAKIPGAAKLEEELADLLPPAVLLGNVIPQVMEMSGVQVNLTALLSNFAGRDNDQDFITCVLNQSEQCVLHLQDVRVRLGDVLYPFKHGHGIVTLAEHSIGEIPPRDMPGAVVEVGDAVADRLLTVYYRLLKKMIVIAEKAELAIGLPALKDLPPEDSFEFQNEDDDD